MSKCKGYVVPNGYMGYIGNGTYRLFSNEGDYIEYYNENKNEIDTDEENT